MARGDGPAPEAPEQGERPSVKVRDLVAREAEGLELTLRAGKRGLDSEIGYLTKLAPARRVAILERLARCRISCFVVTKGLAPPRELLAAADAEGVPVLVTVAESTPFIKHLSAFLEEKLARRLHLHSVLMDVFGLGVLIMGESGIGKSECALDL